MTSENTDTEYLYYTCATCGSMSVQVDSLVEWNVFTQRNEIVSEFDHCFCSQCEGETSCNEQQVKPDDWRWWVAIKDDDKMILDTEIITTSRNRAVWLALEMVKGSTGGMTPDFNTILCQNLDPKPLVDVIREH